MKITWRKQKPKMITGGLDKIAIRQGWNGKEGKFYIQMTEKLYDNNNKPYAGIEMRLFVDKDFYKMFHGAYATRTYEDSIGEKMTR